VSLLVVWVQIFGSDVTDALVNQECLVVLHSGGVVRLYSLQHIVAEVV